MTSKLNIYHTKNMDFTTVRSKHGLPILPGQLGVMIREHLDMLHNGIQIIEEITPATYDDLLLAHAKSYIELLTHNGEAILKEIHGATGSCLAHLLLQVGSYIQASFDSYHSKQNIPLLLRQVAIMPDMISAEGFVVSTQS